MAQVHKKERWLDTGRKHIIHKTYRKHLRRVLYILCTLLYPLYSELRVLCPLPVSRYHPGLTSEKFVIRICFKMTDGQIIYYFYPWKKFIIWDDMRKIRVRQIAYTRYKCTPRNLLCTSSFWKPYKVLYTSVILLLLLSFIYVDSAFFIGMKIIIIILLLLLVIIIIILFHLLT